MTEKTEPEYCFACKEKRTIIKQGYITQPDGLMSPVKTYHCSICKTVVNLRDLV